MPARWTRVIAVMTAAAVAAIGGDAAAKAVPDAGARAGATSRERVDGSGEDNLAVLIAHKGTMLRARLEGRRLVARDAGGGVMAARELSAPDRAALLAA